MSAFEGPTASAPPARVPMVSTPTPTMLKWFICRLLLLRTSNDFRPRNVPQDPFQSIENAEKGQCRHKCDIGQAGSEEVLPGMKCGTVWPTWTPRAVHLFMSPLVEG